MYKTQTSLGVAGLLALLAACDGALPTSPKEPGREVTAPSAIADASWCGSTLDFNGGLLPAGWTAENIRSGPGLVNDRLEGAPTDGGVVISSTGTLPAGTQSVAVRFTGSHAYSVFGQDHQLTVQLGPSMTIVIMDQSAEYNFGLNRLVFLVTANGKVLGRITYPFEYGTMNFIYTLRDSRIDVRAMRSDDGSMVATAYLKVGSLKLASITGMQFRTYATTDNGIWADNLRFVCGT
jgi:hypothetical protein